MVRERLQVADSVLTKRLTALVGAGLLTKKPYDDGGRARLEYVLTAKGEDALPVLNAVVIWAEKHVPAMRPVHHPLPNRTLPNGPPSPEAGEKEARQHKQPRSE